MAERYAFTVEWRDPVSQVVWTYTLLFFADASVELYDPKARRTFLKRTPVPGVRLEHLAVGANVVVMARTLRVTGYADEATRSKLAAQRERRAGSERRAACARGLRGTLGPALFADPALRRATCTRASVPRPSPAACSCWSRRARRTRRGRCWRR